MGNEKKNRRERVAGRKGVRGGGGGRKKNRRKEEKESGRK